MSRVSLAAKAFVYIASVFLALSAQAQHFSSGVKQVPLIELYTSEGCSSCPPADRWLSALKQRDDLWSGFVPIALHVDYWDYIGWKDPFASPEYSQRQRRYAREHNETTVYTPGVRKAGKEWRAWRLRGDPTLAKVSEVGDLSLSISNTGEFSANFENVSPRYKNKALQLNIAVLGLNLATEVKRGENQGKTLEHDFVVLQLSRFSSAKVGSWSGRIEKPAIASSTYAVAAWLSVKGSASPLQSCGGYLNSLIWDSGI